MEQSDRKSVVCFISPAKSQRGYRLDVNQKKHRTLEDLMKELSRVTLCPQPLLKMYDAAENRPIRSLAELENGKCYLASGKGGLPWLQAPKPAAKSTPKTKVVHEKLPPISHRKINAFSITLLGSAGNDQYRFVLSGGIRSLSSVRALIGVLNFALRQASVHTTPIVRIVHKDGMPVERIQDILPGSAMFADCTTTRRSAEQLKDAGSAQAKADVKVHISDKGKLQYVVVKYPENALTRKTLKMDEQLQPLPSSTQAEGVVILTQSCEPRLSALPPIGSLSSSEKTCSSNSSDPPAEETILETPSPKSPPSQTESASSPWSVGLVTDFYTFGDTLGDGNFAVVRTCYSRDDNKEYAVKVINKSSLAGRDYMIVSEVTLLRLCSHANIVRLFDCYDSELSSYLVMERVNGGDLFDAINKAGCFTEGIAASYGRDIICALRYLHDKRIVHRDIKPENIMIQNLADGGETLKLGDFGLAVQDSGPLSEVCGTPTYVAPEIILETGYSFPVDIWAVGVIIFIMLCGYPPFHSPSQDRDELFDSIVVGQFEFLSPYWDNVSEEAKRLLQHLISLDSRKRYTADQCLRHVWFKRRQPEKRKQPAFRSVALHAVAARRIVINLRKNEPPLFPALQTSVSAT